MLSLLPQDMRRQGIAARLMQDLHAHFQRKGYRGSILDADEEAAIQLYQKVGYQQFTQDLQTQLLPNQSAIATQMGGSESQRFKCFTSVRRDDGQDTIFQC